MLFKRLRSLLSARSGARSPHVISGWRSPFTSQRERDRQDTQRLYAAARTGFDASPLRTLDLTEFGHAVIGRVFRRAGRDPGSEIGHALREAAEALLASEAALHEPRFEPSRQLGLEDLVALRTALRTQSRILADVERHLKLTADYLERIGEALLEVVSVLPSGAACTRDAFVTAALVDLVEEPARLIEQLIDLTCRPELVRTGLFRSVRDRLEQNACIASGIDPAAAEESWEKLVPPTRARRMTPIELVEAYLGGTPLADLLGARLPLAIPFETRFEHTHIVGGSGHGKTQALQFLVHRDLTEPEESRPALCIIDSQGDLIRTITHLAIFSPGRPGSLAEKLVLIDPNDIEHPPCLNLFDLGLERVARYGEADREKILNGTIALFEYMFGALLGAELTQRQGVIFKYLARLMMVIPGATIQTLRELIEDDRPYRSHVARLDGAARHFFETQFRASGFAPTRQQILQRLWGILSNPVLERMFSHTENKVDLFEAMQSGKIVVINTAKDLLKRDGSQLLGRFFLAMIGQATLERAVLPPAKRRPCFVYVDEAWEYFDETIDDMLNQARKQKVGLVLAQQNLDQLGDRLRATIMASTSVKLAGGVSAKDTRALAEEMRCAPELIQGAKKRRSSTELACYIRNAMPQAIRVSVPLGYVESQPAMTAAEYGSLLAMNRARYCAPRGDAPLQWREPVQLHAPIAPEGDSQEKLQPQPPPVPGHALPEGAPISPREPDPMLPRPMGKGGQKHIYIQEFVKRLAENLGYRAVIEQPILEGAGQVDVALERGELRIACEISITTSREQELANVRKCLAAGYDQVVLISPENRRVQSLAKFIRENLEPPEQERVSVLVPEDVEPHLAAMPREPPAPSEQVVRGYRVKVRHEPASAADQQARREAIAKVLARSLRQVSG